MRHLLGLIFCGLLAFSPVVAAAQSAALAFGQVKTDPSTPVEVTADALDVNQGDGSAVFTGNVLIIQGDMRLSADRVQVVNRTEGSGIDRLQASGNVVLVSGTDAAEAQRADYSVTSGKIVMTGDVLVSQGASTIASERMEIDLASGAATMSGRVRTFLNTGDQN